jgi:hypothetical protein
MNSYLICWTKVQNAQEGPYWEYSVDESDLEYVFLSVLEEIADRSEQGKVFVDINDKEGGTILSIDFNRNKGPSAHVTQIQWRTFLPEAKFKWWLEEFPNTLLPFLLKSIRQSIVSIMGHAEGISLHFYDKENRQVAELHCFYN